MTKLRGGVGEAPIEFPKDLFPTPNEEYTGVHDAPYAHVFLFQDQEVRYVIVNLDLVNAFQPEHLKKIAAEAAGVPEENILIHCNHSLATPHGAFHIESETEADYDRKYNAVIDAAVTKAGKTAAAKLQEIRIGFGTAVSNVNVNRVIKLGDGLWQGTNESGISDHTVPVVKITAADGTVLGIMYSVNMANGVLEGSRLSDGSRPVSADVAGAAAGFLHKAFPAAVCAYFIGASGDQWQELRAVSDRIDENGRIINKDLHEKGFEFVHGLGNKLASSLTQTINGTETTYVTGTVVMETRDFVYPGQQEPGRMPGGREPGTHITYLPAEDVHSSMSVLRIGDIVFLAAHPEIDVNTLAGIREKSGCSSLFFMEFTNGDGGYMAEKYIYDGCGYQSRKSRFARGSAEMFEENAAGFISDMQGMK